MNDLLKVIRANAEDRRGLFQQTGQRLACAPENVEKDFWVTWTLDALYNKAGIKPRLLFKGGTSLSKAFNLIQRFSEDIDITVFRTDLLGDDFLSDDELRAMGSNQRARKIDEIKERCSGFIKGNFMEALANVAGSELEGLTYKIEPDEEDPDGQSLLFHYPSAFADSDDGYIRRVVKIESGAKSALVPHESETIVPYSATEVEGLNLKVPNVLTIRPERTFWDKIIILHGQRHWFQNKGSLYKDGQRLSRHYYDVYKLLGSDCGTNAIVDRDIAESCVRHARLYFNRKPLDLDLATPGTYGIVPLDEMLAPLKADYEKMAGMIFGDIPPFDDIIGRIAEAEETLNAKTFPTP